MSEEKGRRSFFREVVDNALNRNVDQSIAEQLALVEVEPSNPKPYCALGTLFHIQGRLEDSVMMYRRALELDPGFSLAHQCLGQLYASQGRMGDAWHHAREAARCGNRALLEMLERYHPTGYPSED